MSPPSERILTRNESLQRRYNRTTGLRFREMPSSESPESPESDCLLALKYNPSPGRERPSDFAEGKSRSHQERSK
jgi:hypothetical protein